MKKNLAISLILILMIGSCTLPAFAEDLGNLMDQQENIQSQKNAANSELEGVQGELTTTLQQVLELSNNITAYESQVEELDSKVITLQNSIRGIQEKLDVAQKDYEKQKKSLEERLVAIYEGGETTYLDVLLSSKSVKEFISNYYLVAELTQYDTDLLETIEKEKKEIEDSKKQLETQKKEFNTIKSNKEKTSIILQNTKIMKDSYLSKLTDQEKTIQDQIDAYENQIKQVEAEIMQITMANLDSQYIGGIMAWPVPGYTRITSTYGMRTHPITGIYKLHTGVDIGAPMGTNFIAANDGVVTKASFNNAYGNMVMIDHGGGISTLYAHGSQILVTVGQTVKKGDAVLKVGNTGYSTGAHAHFEVRINGQVTDPMPYITNTSNSNSEPQSN